MSPLPTSPAPSSPPPASPAAKTAIDRARLDRLLRPQSIAVYGGAWADVVVREARKLGFPGDIWRVHPKREGAFRSTDALPAAPDAVFLGVNRAATVDEVAALSARGTGGVVCFASGYVERGDAEAEGLAEALDAAAGSMPIIGPNCYGMVNFLDRAALWPDPISAPPVDRGVAVLSQSGTLSITLMGQRRALPLSHVVSLGNQQRIAAEDLIPVLAADPRVSAIGLYLEGVRDVAAFSRAVAAARAENTPVALVKAGRSAAAAAAIAGHTGSLAGPDAAFDALFERIGVARCESLSSLIETLKLLHFFGPLASDAVMVATPSGGDVAMTAEAARARALRFPSPPPAEAATIQSVAGPGVRVTNPFDFQTHLWFEPEKMRALFDALLGSGYGLTAVMFDPPDGAKVDATPYDAVIEQWFAAARASDAPAALFASLADSFDEALRARCAAAGVAPLQGMTEGLEAVEQASRLAKAWARLAAAAAEPSLRRPSGAASAAVISLDEDAAKARLAEIGAPTPKRAVATPETAVETAERIGFPVVAKAVGAALLHKTELGGVALGLKDPAAVAAAAARLATLSDQLLIEEMIEDGVAEMILGVQVLPDFGPVLTIGAGGVFTELLKDAVTLLPPVTPEEVIAAVSGLRIHEVLKGWRGKPAADIRAFAEAAAALAAYAERAADRLVELELNPVILRPSGVVAVDALLRERAPA